MGKTLIVIDFQYDFLGGALGSEEAMAIIPNVKNKIKEYRERGDSIVFTMDIHKDNYLDTYEGRKLPIPHCIEKTVGSLIACDVSDPTKDKIIHKESFAWPYWASMMFTGDIEIIGLCTDICVIANAMVIKAMYPETDITVDASCCAGTTPEAHNAALRVMKSCQINVVGDNNND